MSTTQTHIAEKAVDSNPAPPAYTGPASQPSSNAEIAPAPISQQQHDVPLNQNRNYEAFNEPVKPDQDRMQYVPQNNQHGSAAPARLVMPLANLQDRPVEVDCPYCQRVTMTRVEEHSSSMTIIAGVIIGLFCICLACLPCIMHTCADVDHFCSNCGKQLTHRPYEGTTAVVAQGGRAGGPPPGSVPSKYAEGTVQQAPAPAHPPNPSGAFGAVGTDRR